MGKIKKSVDVNASGDVVFDLIIDLDRSVDMSDAGRGSGRATALPHQPAQRSH